MEGFEFDNLHYCPPHPHTFYYLPTKNRFVYVKFAFGEERRAESKQIIADHAHYQLEEKSLVFVEKYLGYIVFRCIWHTVS